MNIHDGMGTMLIEAERLNQQHIGYDLNHDLEHATEDLHNAGHAYEKNDLSYWPWDAADFKPRNHLDNLIRAGALYLAANDRADHTDTTNYRNYAIACGEQIDTILNRAHEIDSDRENIDAARFNALRAYWHDENPLPQKLGRRFVEILGEDPR